MGLSPPKAFKTRKFFRTLVFSTVLMAIAEVAHAVVWDMPTGYSDKSYHTQNIRRFADAVTKATSGELTIRVHSGGSLFKGAAIKHAVQTGQAFIGERLLSAHRNEFPIFSLDSIPFLATSFEDSTLLWQAAKPVINKYLADKNLLLLYSVPWPPQGFFTNKEIRTVDDFKGMRIHGYNSLTAYITLSLKAKAVKYPYSRVRQAIKEGDSDGFIATPGYGNHIKAWEHVSHYNDFQAWFPRNYVFVNLEQWNMLPQNIRDTVTAIAEMAEHGATQEAENITNWYLDEFRKNGIQIIKPSPKLLGNMAINTYQVLEDYLKKTGKEGLEIIQTYKELKKQAVSQSNKKQ